MLDRTRLIVTKRIGTDPVDPNTSFQEGDLLHYSPTGWKRSDSATANVIRGIAGINKTSSLNSVVIGESVSFATGDTQNLSKGNIVANSVRVTDPTGATVYTEGTDYTINYTNGQITREAGGSIPEGGTVLVSFSFQMSLELAEEEVGFPLSNSMDETLGSGKVTVLTGICEIATDRYDTSKAYAVNDNLYDNGDGLLTSDGSGGKVLVGKVKVPPSAADRFLIAVLNL